MADLYGMGFNTVMPQAKVNTVMLRGRKHRIFYLW